jgi:uncharacterized protein (TIGR00730 family)
MNRICVFCASSSNCDDLYYKESAKLGQMLARAGKEIIYGGGNIGMMKSLADGAISEGGKVIGVIPSFMQNLELGHKGVSELREVADMHQREAMMIRESDYIIALPGGTGTFSELIQAITWKQLGLINTPIIVINLENYFGHLIEQYNTAFKEKFNSTDYSKLFTVVDSVEDAMYLIDNKMPVTPLSFDFA